MAKKTTKAQEKSRPIGPDGKPVPWVDPTKIAEGHLHWLVRPKTIRTLIMVGSAVLLALTLADLVMHGHPHFGIDGSFGFYTWFGFVTCAAMVVFAKLLGFAIKRPDSFYDD